MLCSSTEGFPLARQRFRIPGATPAEWALIEYYPPYKGTVRGKIMWTLGNLSDSDSSGVVFRKDCYAVVEVLGHGIEVEEATTRPGQTGSAPVRDSRRSHAETQSNVRVANAAKLAADDFTTMILPSSALDGIGVPFSAERMSSDDMQAEHVVDSVAARMLAHSAAGVVALHDVDEQAQSFVGCGASQRAQLRKSRGGELLKPRSRVLSDLCGGGRTKRGVDRRRSKNAPTDSSRVGTCEWSRATARRCCVRWSVSAR